MKDLTPRNVVRAWEESITIPTYRAGAPEKLPMFLDKRVYQGSNGKVYPNPFTDRVSDDVVDVTYQAVYLENEYIRVMILPEIGGRIHIGQDKTNGYDFFYRQNVIKPALVGLLGPWISGGVEFNWPQHHRPSTFMPVEYYIEEQSDGSRTVWLSEHEPMNRMKGMIGIRLHPGSSRIEAKIRLYNRTAFTQTFLWWANVGVRVHDRYQSFFPPDVTFVADHAKRAITSFPLARSFYYGVDYTRGVDLTWYKNIPVPTSYMVTESEFDFFGGYDHAADAGFVHVANRFLAPGKKQWTWGNAEFGYAWDRELTDADGPYIELMAGVYTDNQPDFSFLAPYETKSFSQFWYPIQKIGPVKNANESLAINLHKTERGWEIGVCVSERLDEITIRLTHNEGLLFERKVNLTPGGPFLDSVSLSDGSAEGDLRLAVLDSRGAELLAYTPCKARDAVLPSPAQEPPQPSEIQTSEELYLTGLHLEQYRHATRAPELYWHEAIKRDSGDAHCHHALGLSLFRQGRFADAERHFRAAVERLTFLNPNPYDGEPLYSLALCLTYQEKNDEAYGFFYKSTWNYAWKTAGYYAVALIDCARAQYSRAVSHLDLSLRADPDHLKARNLKTTILRKLGRIDEAQALAEATIELDALDLYSRNELCLLQGSCQKKVFQLFRGETQTYLDIAFDYARAGLWQDADDLLISYLTSHNSANAYPMLWYARAYFAERLNKTEQAKDSYRKAKSASPDYCFPARLEELLLLEAALKHDPTDARAHYYLGNLLYDKKRKEEAITHWEAAVRIEPGFSIPWRNLGMAYFNVRGDTKQAMECYRQARHADPEDARLLYEFDQLRKRGNVSPQERLDELERRRDLVGRRDDLTVELVTLYNEHGKHTKALSEMSERRFHPWEGGEGAVSGQYVFAHIQLGRDALDRDAPAQALFHFKAAREYPWSLGEGKHLLTPESHLDYFEGLALTQLGLSDEARVLWDRAADTKQGANMFGYFSGLALRSLGDEPAARCAFEALTRASEDLANTKATIDYFATSLPNLLLFEDDLQKRQQVEALFLRGLASLGLGRMPEGVRDLEAVLQLDNNHLWARAELLRARALVEQQVMRG